MIVRVAFGELVRAIHPRGGRHRTVALLAAYLDESGTHAGSSVTVIAGVVGDATTWDAFDIQWRQYLAVDVPYYHSAELEAVQGVYAGLEEPFRKYLARWMPQAIQDHKVQVLSQAVVTKDLEAICAKYPDFGQWFSSAYLLCFHGCIQEAADWSENHANGEPMSLIFARQDEYKERATQAYAAYKRHQRWGRYLTSITFAEMPQYTQLQAADLIAREIYLTFSAWLEQSTSFNRAVLPTLLDAGIDISGTLATYDDLERLIQQGPSDYLTYDD